MATKSYDEILAEKQAKTAKRLGTTVDELNEQYGEETSEEQADDQPAEQYEEPEEDLRGEISKLKSQLAAMKGRVAPEQQRVAALENTMNMMERQYKDQLAEMQSKLDEANKLLEKNQAEDFELKDILSEDEIDLIDPLQMDAFKKVAIAASKRFAPRDDVDARVRNILEQERANQVNTYRNRILGDSKNPGSRIMALSDDPEFKDWVDANPDVRFTIGALVNARSNSDVDAAMNALNKRVRDFDEQKRSRKGGQKTDPATSLSSAMRREPQDSSSKRREELMASANKLKEMARSRNRNSDAARALFDKIQSF